MDGLYKEEKESETIRHATERDTGAEEDDWVGVPNMALAAQTQADVLPRTSPVAAEQSQQERNAIHGSRAGRDPRIAKTVAAAGGGRAEEGPPDLGVGAQFFGPARHRTNAGQGHTPRRENGIQRCDPASMVQILRSAAESWFGNIAVMRRARSALASHLDKSTTDDDVVRDKIRQLDDRIEALEVIGRHLDAREADALKRHEFPKAQHLKHLVELDQIASVSAPVHLPSPGDQGDRGTLFELKITPHPLSDGNEAPSVYLHLHTSRPVTAAQCLKLKGKDDFTASHVKNEAQKNCGPRWVQIQQHYGNEDARVHRGPVDKELLGTMQKLSMTSLAGFSGAPSRVTSIRAEQVPARARAPI